MAGRPEGGAEGGDRLQGHPEGVGHGRGGEEVHHEMGTGQGEGHVHLPTLDPKVEAHAEGRPPPVQGGHVVPAVAAEPDHALAKARADAP